MAKDAKPIENTQLPPADLQENGAVMDLVAAGTVMTGVGTMGMGAAAVKTAFFSGGASPPATPPQQAPPADPGPGGPKGQAPK
ncbi:MAG: hypothetical protein ACLQMH_10050 [Solirubrobacteraceae bacterium]